jgi:hypothetical protein
MLATDTDTSTDYSNMDFAVVSRPTCRYRDSSVALSGTVRNSLSTTQPARIDYRSGSFLLSQSHLIKLPPCLEVSPKS